MRLFVNLASSAGPIASNLWQVLPAWAQNVIIFHGSCVVVGVIYVLYRERAARRLPRQNYSVVGDPYKVELPNVK